MISDSSSKQRIQDGIDDYLKDNPVYYIPDYPLQKLSHMVAAGPDYIKDKQILNYYNTLSYKMIKHIGYENSMILRMSESFNFIVTSIDQKGILAALNMNTGTNIHPGNKRLLCARYLNLDTVPILYDTGRKLENYRRVRTIDDIFDIYDKDISVRIVNRFDRNILEVSWHGETKTRDSNGNDDWITASATRNGFVSLPKFFMKNGIEIVNSKRKFITEIEGFKTTFTTERKSKVSIEVLDDSLIGNVDFWELYFHIDPVVYRKECASGKINIINDFADNDITLKNCSLYKTLMRA